MRITAVATKTGISIRENGTETELVEEDLKVTCRGYHGINTDAAEMALEDRGLGVMHWIWNAEKKHYITLLVKL